MRQYTCQGSRITANPHVGRDDRRDDMSQLKKLEPAIRLSIKNPESDSGSVFGRGIADLCLGVRETGSLNAAAKGMGMAYSKAWRIIKDTETALDVQLLYRNGAHGSQLTEDCERILEAYQAIESDLQAEAERRFQEALKR